MVSTQLEVSYRHACSCRVMWLVTCNDGHTICVGWSETHPGGAKLLNGAAGWFGARQTRETRLLAGARRGQ
jgi:hypothetical protein